MQERQSEKNISFPGRSSSKRGRPPLSPPSGGGVVCVESPSNALGEPTSPFGVVQGAFDSAVITFKEGS